MGSTGENNQNGSETQNNGYRRAKCGSVNGATNAQTRTCCRKPARTSIAARVWCARTVVRRVCAHVRQRLRHVVNEVIATQGAYSRQPAAAGTVQVISGSTPVLSARKRKPLSANPAAMPKRSAQQGTVATCGKAEENGNNGAARAVCMRVQVFRQVER